MNQPVGLSFNNHVAVAATVGPRMEERTISNADDLHEIICLLRIAAKPQDEMTLALAPARTRQVLGAFSLPNQRQQAALMQVTHLLRQPCNLNVAELVRITRKQPGGPKSAQPGHVFELIQHAQRIVYETEVGGKSTVGAVGRAGASWAEVVASAYASLPRMSAWVYVVIGGVTVRALVDTGAGIEGAVNTALLTALGDDHRRDPRNASRVQGAAIPPAVLAQWDGYITQTELQSVTGQGVAVGARFKGSINVGDMELAASFIDMPTSKYPVLLGADFLFKHGIDVLMSTDELWLANGTKIPLHGRVRTGGCRPKGRRQILSALQEGKAYPGVTKEVHAPLATVARVARMTTIPPHTMYDVAVVVAKPLVHEGNQREGKQEVAMALIREQGVTSEEVLECVQPAYMVVDTVSHHRDGFHRWQVINPHPHAVVLEKGWTMGLATIEGMASLAVAPKPVRRTTQENAVCLQRLAEQLAWEDANGLTVAAIHEEAEQSHLTGHATAPPVQALRRKESSIGKQMCNEASVGWRPRL